MTLHTQTNTRHRIRPLNVFTFCGQPIAAARDEYNLLTKNLPACPACKRAHDRAALSVDRRHRRLA
jgi:hypothetical protein